MSTLSELKEQLRRLVSGEPVRTKYGKFNFSPEIPDDGYERAYEVKATIAAGQAAYARDQLVNDIEILEAFESETTTEPEIQEQKPAKHLKKATNTFKFVHSSKHLNERRKFESIYNTEKMKERPPIDAAIIRKAKKDYPKTIGPIPDSTIRKWIKNSDT